MIDPKEAAAQESQEDEDLAEAQCSPPDYGDDGVTRRDGMVPR